jgi:leucyl aminopeptidase (aminopeptidase T)
VHGDVRVAPSVELSPEERTALENWARRNPVRDFRALRARVVLRAADGRQDLAIARELRISRLTAARWRRRFLASRLRGIEARSSPGPRLGRIAEDQLRMIVRAAGGRNPDGNRPWSTRALAHQIGVSHSTVRRVWEAYHLRPERYPLLPPRPDPRARLVPNDVVAIYLRPPDLAVAFALGPPGVTKVAPEARPGASQRLGRLEDAFGPAPAVPFPMRSREFLRFLGTLSTRVGPAQDLEVVAVLPGLPGSQELDRWKSRHPSVRLELLPGAGPWQDRIDSNLVLLGGRTPGLRGLGGRGELARAIRLSLGAYRTEAGPFEWVATAKESAIQKAGYRLRYELSVTGHPGFKRPPEVRPPMARSVAADPRTREMARAVLRKSLAVGRGERVTIQTWSETIAVANAFVLETLRLGARPILLYQDEPTYWAAAAEVPASHLAHLGDHARAALERSDAFVSFFGPSDRERFHALPRPIASRLGEYHDALYRAVAKSGARAVQMALGRASEASARLYAVDLEVWRNELIDATLVSPEKLHARAVRISEMLRSGRELRIRHSNGTDLRLGLRGRKPQVSDGLVPRRGRKADWDLVQLPAGVVTVALDERTAEGRFCSNVPNTIGVMDTIGEIAGGKWSFERGRLVRYTYDQGQEVFGQSYERAGPGRERPGTLSIGLNEKIRISPLLMDQGYGTLTLQIGRNESAGGATKLYWWAWLLQRGADLQVDGEYLVKGGHLVS